MRPLHIAIGIVLLALLRKPAQAPVLPVRQDQEPRKPVDPPTAPTKGPASTVRRKRPIQTTKTPKAKPIKPKPEAARPRPSPTPQETPLTKASLAFGDAMRKGLTEEEARKAALSVYRAAGGKKPDEEARILRFFFD